MSQNHDLAGPHRTRVVLGNCQGLRDPFWNYEVNDRDFCRHSVFQILLEFFGYSFITSFHTKTLASGLWVLKGFCRALQRGGHMRTIAVVALLASVTLHISCGGNSTAAVHIAPPPRFNSTAPAEATEAAVYTYTVEATDPANTAAVTFTLITAPAGASLAGSILTWTPTAAQSRVPNNFTIMAQTAAGGKATQSWSVTPKGSIRGSHIDTYWDIHGRAVQVPHDLSDQQWIGIYAMVPRSDGSLLVLRGAGSADGTFTIPEVPGGYYWLQVYGGDLYWTSSSTFDLGSDYIGRPPGALVTTALSLDLTNLDSSSVSSRLAIWTPNCNETGNGNHYLQGWSCFQEFKDIPAGATAVKTYPLGSVYWPPIDASKGDVSYLFQQVTTTAPAEEFQIAVIGPALTLPALTINPGQETNIAGALTQANPQSVDVIIKGSIWTQMLQNAAPSSASAVLSWFEGHLFAQPSTIDGVLCSPAEMTEWWGRRYNAADVVSVHKDAPQNYSPQTDVNLGTVQFNNPFPANWMPGSWWAFSTDVRITMPDGNWGSTIVNSYLGASLPTGVFVPQMSPVRNPLLNGASLFTAATINTTAVTLSWEPPTGLSAYGYYVFIHDQTYYFQLGLYTSTTSLTLPAPFLHADKTYIINIWALADGRADMAMSPWRSAFPLAQANVVSAPLTISPGATTPAFLGNEDVIRHIAAQIRTSSRGSTDASGNFSGRPHGRLYRNSN